MDNNIRHIAIDGGFGNFKIAEAKNGRVWVDYAPSVVGIGKTDLGLLETLPGERRKKQDRPFTVSFDGVSYLTGQNVQQYARAIPAQRLDFQRLAQGPELKALLYTMLWKAVNGGPARVALMVGLPVEVMQERDLGLETLRKLRAWLVGEHAFSVNGQAATVEVTQVKAMAQPAGAYFAWGLDTAGRWAQPAEAKRSPVAVIDGGFNTLDLFTVQGGRVESRYTGGDKLGMRRANEIIRNSVKERFGVALSLHEADLLARTYAAGQKPVIYYAGGQADISDLASQAMNNAFASVNAFIEEKMGNARQFPYLLMTGGQTAMLKKQLVEQYPHAIFFPLTANAEGMAKYAARPRVF